MTDEELCRTLRLLAFQYNDGAPSQAADRIEELEAENARLRSENELLQEGVTAAHFMGYRDGLAATTPPSPEAIVRAALEGAAKLFDQDADDMRKKENSFYWTAEMDAERIRSLASDPAEVAAIIKAAGEDRG
jgi:hypothetical protein